MWFRDMGCYTEIFNNWVKDHKDLPVCELADKIRVKIMKLFSREGLERS
jgi:hypothetical protein